MSDYTPVYVPGKVITLTASAAVSGGDLLVVSGSGTVAKLAFGASQQVIVGVAADDTPVNGRVTVYARGIVHESVAMGTVTAGDLLTTPITGDTAGSQVKTAPPDANSAGQEPTVYDAAHTAAAVNLARSVFGIALTTATNPNKVRWMEV